MRVLRHENGWSQRELARRAGVNKSTVERVETGTTSQPETLVALEVALFLRPGSLLELRPAAQAEKVRSARRHNRRRHR